MTRFRTLLLRPLRGACALAALAVRGFAWESCREAVASGASGLARGFNLSIYFMLGMVLLVPLGFLLAVWNSYRVARRKGQAATSPELGQGR